MRASERENWLAAGHAPASVSILKLKVRVCWRDKQTETELGVYPLNGHRKEELVGGQARARLGVFEA